jgi:hypothetical protein
MKKTIIFLISLSFCFYVYAQDKLNKLSTNPVSLIVANMNNFEFERGFSEGKLGVAFYYGKTGNVLKAVNGYKINASEEAVSFNIYLKNIGKPAFWFGPRLSFTSASISDEKYPTINYANNIGTLGLCMSFGGQIVVGGLYLSPFFSLGGALTNNLWGEAKYYGNIKESHIIINYGLKTGIAF